MRCPSCQAENPPTQKFCGECGARLPAACPACGHPNLPTQKFCGECGAKLGATAQPATAAPPPAPAPAAEEETAAPSSPGPSAAFRDAAPVTYTPKHLAEKILASRITVEGARKQISRSALLAPRRSPPPCRAFGAGLRRELPEPREQLGPREA